VLLSRIYNTKVHIRIIMIGIVGSNTRWTKHKSRGEGRSTHYAPSPLFYVYESYSIIWMLVQGQYDLVYLFKRLNMYFFFLLIWAPYFLWRAKWIFTLILISYIYYNWDIKLREVKKSEKGSTRSPWNEC
jgi:hypothetical protein